MIKDDTKDQISLFDLGRPDTKPEEAKTGELPGSASPQKMRREKKPQPAPQPSPKKMIDRGTRGKPAAKTAAATRAARPVPGPVPEGDVRLTANIREDLHLKLKIVAATRRTTIGELIEELVEQFL